MTELRIDKADREQPLYRQIADRIISGIRERHLEPGGRLPTVRELAEELEVTRVTAHNAYRFLSSEGWIDATWDVARSSPSDRRYRRRRPRALSRPTR